MKAGLIFSGGVALGAYHAGVADVLNEAPELEIDCVAGASIGAYMAALVAGNAPQARTGRMDDFWRTVSIDGALAGLPPWPQTEHAVRAFANVLAARTTGVPGLFHPLPRLFAAAGGPGLYDTEPARATLERLVDFDRLNEGAPRCCIGATDVETGLPVVFDTAAGAQISQAHVRASGSLIPSFPPLEVEGRRLADGGLSANVPLEPLLGTDRIVDAPPVVFLMDLFPLAGPVPQTLGQAQERAYDIMFAAQTRLRLDAIMRERALEARLAPERPGTTILLLSCPPGCEPAGPEKTFDFSHSAIARRREQGRADARAALQHLATNPPLAEASRGSRARLRAGRIHGGHKVRDMKIRRAHASDREAVYAIVCAAFADYVPLIGRPPAPMLADYGALIGRGEVHVAEGPDGLAGVAVFRPADDHVYLETLAVRPDLAGRGIGRALMAACEAAARQQGCVRLSTNEKMADNLKIYPRLGYVETHRGREDGYDRVFFEKRF